MMGDDDRWIKYRTAAGQGRPRNPVLERRWIAARRGAHQVVSMSLSNRVHVTEHFFIVLGDGTRLAARLWLQEGADATPVPAILEYIPYRKRDGTRGRDEPMHPGSPRRASICGL
jgi:predicted acyl esterase